MPKAATPDDRGYYSLTFRRTSGRMYLPQKVCRSLCNEQKEAIKLQFTIDDFPIYLHTNVSSLEKQQPFITIPERLLDLIDDDQTKLTVRFESAEKVPFKTQKASPLVGMVRFVGTVRQDGEGGQKTVSVPTIWFDFLQRSGWRVAEISLFDLDKHELIHPFVHTLSFRRTHNQEVLIIILLPKILCERVSDEQKLIVELRPVSDAPLSALIVNDQFAWTAFRTDSAEFIAAESDRTLLVGQRSQITVKNKTDLNETLWAIGLYLAEGAKTGLEFSIINKSPELLERFVKFIADWGISKTRIIVDVSYDPEEFSEAEARMFYDKVASLRAVHAETPEGRIRRVISGTVRVRESLIVVDLFREVLNTLIANERVLSFPSEALWHFIIGYMDGDGSFILSKDGPNLGSLRLHPGNSREADVTKEALLKCLKKSKLDPTVNDGSKEDKEDSQMDFSTTLTFFEKIELICQGAFRYSVARPRLFHSAKRTIKNLLQTHHVGAAVRWGLIDSETKEPTSKTRRAIERLNHHEAEWQHILKLYPTLENCIGHPGKKGRLYFYGEEINSNPWKYNPKAVVNRKKASGDPSIHHPEAKQKQIRDCLKGKSNLKIYEVHGGFGYCSAAFMEFGSVVSRTHEEGDETHLTNEEIANKQSYDVVDLDPYGYSAIRLLPDAVRLLNKDGFLFLTIPTGRIFSPPGDTLMEAACGFAKPPIGELIRYIEKVGRLYNREVVVQDILHLGAVWRIAMKSHKCPVRGY